MTWNLEQVSGSSPRGGRQRQKLAELNADVLVLTEAHLDVLPAGYRAVTSAPIPTGEAKVKFALVAAATLEPVWVPELPTAAAALVTCDAETWLVVGICMPWRRDAPPLPPGTAPPGASGSEAWLHVLDTLDVALFRLRQDHPQPPVLLAGDFNQSLTGRIVGSRSGRVQLRRLLGRHRLFAFTEASPSAIPCCPSIDHICAPSCRRTLKWSPGWRTDDRAGHES